MRTVARSSFLPSSGRSLAKKPHRCIHFMKQCMVSSIFVPLRYCVVQCMCVCVRQCMASRMIACLRRCMVWCTIPDVWRCMVRCLISDVWRCMVRCIIPYLWHCMVWCLNLYVWRSWSSVQSRLRHFVFQSMTFWCAVSAVASGGSLGQGARHYKFRGRGRFC